jgi:hypothetical protein
MQHVERLVGLFVEAHPRATMDRMLSFLCGEHAAAGALLFALVDGAPVLEGTRSLHHERWRVFQGAWQDHRNRLLAGEVIEGTGFVAAGLTHRGSVVGLLFLDAPSRFRAEGIDVYLFALAKALLSARAQGPELSPGVGVDQRALLIAVLERHEWNIARVARELQVTRRTIYLRMVRYGIKRRHVPKLAKPVI